ncbi:MAG: hypothetical protein K2K36_04390 [Muribaculaceae bacterium]|nr:hypothetical protein [Muribaculaceae bacterium]
MTLRRRLISLSPKPLKPERSPSIPPDNVRQPPRGRRTDIIYIYLHLSPPPSAAPGLRADAPLPIKKQHK